MGEILAGSFQFLFVDMEPPIHQDCPSLLESQRFKGDALLALLYNHNCLGWAFLDPLLVDGWMSKKGMELLARLPYQGNGEKIICIVTIEARVHKQKAVFDTKTCFPATLR